MNQTYHHKDAQVVEGELARMFGVSERAPLLGEVHCIGTETELLECSHTSIGRHSCGINVVPPVPDIVISCVGMIFTIIATVRALVYAECKIPCLVGGPLTIFTFILVAWGKQLEVHAYS